MKANSFKIETKNTFPHSSGIASSASGMAALAMCLVKLEALLSDVDINAYYTTKASFLARLGSGSASRSIQGPIVVWGAHEAIQNSNNLFGIPYPYDVHKNFSNYQDTILLVDKGEKQVSSSVGHDLMHNNPYAAERFKEANTNLAKLEGIFKSGDLSGFMAIVESEALQLLMATSQSLVNTIDHSPEDAFEQQIIFARIGGSTESMPMHQICHHVLNHSTYHRGQIVTLLRHVGYNDITSTDLLNFYNRK